ncbi:DNA primase [Actibacterium lipolyticum]|uniref:DNA primase n=1 Tax=Actibacterium lipolyticum TaxID=1524263 RepID=A0A238JS66_9RHOB|nr:DNA primase [Actibacterium lipolyticum]SMX33415.1 DNA primase [Actibacterium lipolyticum]
MSLPPGFLDELRTRTSLSQVVGRKVMWDARKSNQGKGDMWAPCPFHQEKSASFHVDDRKGYYYCFGCHAKGDAISFVRETENVGFMEAIEILAGEAGMQMPARDPQAQQKADRRTQLAEVMEQAVQHYRLQLKTGGAAAARDYLVQRGLSEAAQERWEIGFAPDHRQGVFSHLTGKGVAADLVVDAGLAAKPDGGGAPYDRFRGRIIFPIRDARGRAIALGGRAMDPNARAKYLNSPETELFDKGRSLFNQGPAREAAGKGQPLIVAEGYMDVIALSEAGFGACVAPLGTAVTESQLQMLWRIHPEPIVALDGDTAGLRAAMRLIDLALPLLEAGQSLRFALMPQGQDPDDVIRSGGAGAMQKLLDAAQPMVQLLWQRETEGKVFDSPERKAALDKDLRAAIAKIKDPSIRGHYGEEIKNLRWELFGAQRSKKKRTSNWKSREADLRAKPTTKNSALVAAPPQFEEELREAVILATLITHPTLLPGFEGELEQLEFVVPEHRRLQGALLTHLNESDPAVLQKAIEGTIGPAPLEKLFSLSHVQIAPPLQNRADSEKALMCIAEELAKLEAARGVTREIEDAVQDLAGLADEGLTWRLSQAAEAYSRAGRGDTEDTGEYDIGPNGARLSRDERSAFDQLLEQIEFSKASKRPS